MRLKEEIGFWIYAFEIPSRTIHTNGTVISPEGEATELDDFRTVVLKGAIGGCGEGCLNIEHRTPNIEHQK